MPRPSKNKRIGKLPLHTVFTAQGAEKASGALGLLLEEYETLRLIDYLGYTQEACAQRMQVGRATVQALYTSARKKTARFLVEGTTLCIQGGNYELCQENMDLWKGESLMKLAVTYENGEIFQHFGHTEQFKIYEIEEGKILSSQVVDTKGSGHGALAGFLQDLGVQVLICGGIGGGARNALAEVGISLYPGASGDADSQVASFLAGALAYDPDTVCSHHSHEHGESCGGHGQEGGGCGSHGAGHSCGQGGCGH